jgi:protein TonB
MYPEKRRSAGRTRWIALTSVGVQGIAVAALVAIPLIWPEKLPPIQLAPKVTLAAMKKPEVKVEPKPVRVETTNDAVMRAPASAPQLLQTGPSRLAPRGASPFSSDDGPSLYNNVSMTGNAIGSLGTTLGSGPGGAPTVVTAAPKKPAMLNVSSGVSKGMLLSPIQPIYPRIAIAAHIEGTVTVTAIIDKQGRITGLQVLSGPEMLRTAAVDAIKDARYRPFLLNGEPTDVITTIAVNFRMGG